LNSSNYTLVECILLEEIGTPKRIICPDGAGDLAEGLTGILVGLFALSFMAHG
jgi:hypothetical protein